MLMGTWRNRSAMIAVLSASAAVFASCGGSSSGGQGVLADRQAGAITRGTAVCIRNSSSDTLRIEITQAENDQPEYADTNGTEDLAPNGSRCMKSDSLTAGGTARAKVTIASGETFVVEGFNPPWDPSWIAVNGDARTPAVGATTDFKIGKHPIVAQRNADVSSYVQFGVTIR